MAKTLEQWQQQASLAQELGEVDMLLNMGNYPLQIRVKNLSGYDSKWNKPFLDHIRRHGDITDEEVDHIRNKRRFR